MSFLNIVYGGTRAEIKTDGIERIGELQDAIKAKYGEFIAAPPAAIQLYKCYPDERIATMADYRALPNEFYVEGGPCVEIHTFSRLPPLKQTPLKDFIEDFLSKLAPGTIRSKSEEDIAASASAYGDTTMDIDADAKIEEHARNKLESTPIFDSRVEHRLRKLGLRLPYERIPKECFNKGRATVLAGVSGCGKSRTCIDIALQRNSLYFDSIAHRDVVNMYEELETKDASPDDLKRTARIYFCALVVARVSLLEHVSPATKKRVVSFQCSTSFQLTSLNLMKGLLSYPSEQLSSMAEAMLSGNNGYTCLFDEAQLLMEKMKNRFENSAGQFVQPLLRVLVETVSMLGACSFWCGTALRLKDISLFLTGMAKPSDVTVFTDFQHYTFDDIKALIGLYAKEPEYSSILCATPDALLKACYFLQGRPRLITTFMEYLKDVKHGTFETVLKEYLESLTTFVEGTHLLIPSHFWQRVLQYPEKLRNIRSGESRDSKTPDVYCFELLANYLFAAPQLHACEVVAGIHDADLISTSLVSLKRPLVFSGSTTATYWITEPVILEAAVNVFETKESARKRFMKSCTQLILGPRLNGL